MGEEYPGSDPMHVVFLVIYFAVWAVDSYFLRFSVFLADQIPWQLRLVFTLAFIILGGWMIMASHNMVFGEEGESELCDVGVYSLVRHPMYLGILLLYLGVWAFTVSLATVAVWFGIFYAYNVFAAFEEEDLVRVFGERYVEYQSRVPRWFPRRLSMER